MEQKIINSISYSNSQIFTQNIRSKMLASIFNPPKALSDNFQKQVTQINNFVLLQIIIMKIAVVAMAIFLPLMFEGDTVCFCLTIAVALEFWTNKNLARSFLKAHWFVDTSTEKDRWVYEAKVKKPDTYEGLFWFSSLIYMVLLTVCLLYYISRHQLSLSCSLFIGLVCSYLNFFAYSKIMKLREEGVLEKISADVGENNFDNGATIQLPLITVRSQLKEINQDEEYMEMS